MQNLGSYFCALNKTFVHKTNLLRLALSSALLLPFVVLPSSAPAQDGASSPDSISAAATRAYNEKDYEFSAKQWQRLIAEHPGFSQLGKAHYYLGISSVRTEKFPDAIANLQTAIGKLENDDAELLPIAYLFLGFSQLRHGRNLQSVDANESQKLLTTATETLASMIRKYNKHKDVDQAYFFQGEAFEELGRFDRAEESFSKMLQLEDPSYKLDGLHALGHVQYKLGKHVQAIESFERFESEGGENPAINEVRFRAGDALKKLSESATNLGEAEDAKRFLNQAMAKFAQVAAANEPAWSEQALMEQASCANKTGDYKRSAQLYEQAMAIPNSRFVEEARLLAGRDYIDAGNGTRAAELLEKAVAADSKFSPEAAHWLSQLYLRSGQNEKAFRLADQWIAKTKEERVLAPLMLGRADAAYANNDRKAESQKLYLELADKFPKHKLAEAALYNAAYSAKEAKDVDTALQLIKRFEKEFENGDYLPSMLAVKGDCYFLKRDPVTAGDIFADMIDRFRNHPKIPKWKLNTAMAKHESKEYKTAIEILEPLITQLKGKAQQAEALHWMGSSHFHLNQNSEAIAALQQSHATDSQWRRADETLLALARAFQQSNQPVEADKWMAEIRKQFPRSPLIPESRFRLAESKYKNGQYEDAISIYQEIIEKHGDSEIAPNAKYGLGWALIKQKQFDDAADTFAKLISEHEKHELAQAALVGRASAYRQSGDPDKAIVDVREFLKTNPERSVKIDATYEMGLAQIDKKDWRNVSVTFRELLKLDSQSNLADQFHYELAWANRSLQEDEKALEHFKTIATEFPGSKHAAESNFHLAQDQYQKQKYTDAIPFYEASLKTASAGSIKEKAMHKLAWTHYKKGDFVKANELFRDQVQAFPDGSELYGHGLFMVSETYYENQQHEKALEAYRVARPVLETAGRVTDSRLLNLLHGAQVANKVKNFKEALAFAEPLLTLDVDDGIKQEAYMQIGDAQRGLKNNSEALAAYQKAAVHPGVTGARSRCMIGDLLFTDKNFEDAIDNYKLVGFGYGGDQANERVKGWQAYATFEVARSYFVQISNQTNPAMKKKMTENSIKYFQKLIEKYPGDRLAEQAKAELKKLGAGS